MRTIRYLVGDNLGGVAMVNFIAAEDVVSIPPPVGSTIASDIILMPGKVWHEMYFSCESASYQEAERITRHGEEFTRTLKGFLPYNHPQLAATLALLRRRRLVLALEDSNGHKLLVGNPEEYLRLEWTLDTEAATSGRNGYQVSLTGKGRLPTPFYTGQILLSETQMEIRNTYLLTEAGEFFTTEADEKIIL